MKNTEDKKGNREITTPKKIPLTDILNLIDDCGTVHWGDNIEVYINNIRIYRGGTDKFRKNVGDSFDDYEVECMKAEYRMLKGYILLWIRRKDRKDNKDSKEIDSIEKMEKETREKQTAKKRGRPVKNVVEVSNAPNISNISNDNNENNGV